MPRDVKSASELSQTRSTKGTKHEPISPNRHRVFSSGANRQLNDNQKPDAEGKQVGGQIVLLPHQVKAVETVGAASLGVRLIGDEMRVGKTPTAIAIDLSLRREVSRRQRGNDCTLIVCPKSAISVWTVHLFRMGVRSDRVFEIDLPSKQALKALLARIAENKRNSSSQAFYVVINWDAVQTIERELKRAGPWFHIIGDEIHRIKGRDTKRTTAFKRVKAKQLTGLSGTPADNRPEDFWSVLNWLLPREFASYWGFVDEYCTVSVTKSGFKKITGVKSKALPGLRKRIGPYYIRRLLSEVADSLPQKQYRTVTVDMGAKQRREYDKFKEKDIAVIDGGDVLADYDVVKLIRLQQMAIGCCAGEWTTRSKRDEDTGKMVEYDYFDVHITDKPASPKLDALMELILDEPELGPFIIFAQHHDTIRLASKRCQDAGFSTTTIIGTDSPETRRCAVADYQSGRADIFIGSIGACREAITLSRANTIIFVDRAWNPNWNRQAEARADSLTSTVPVTIIYLQTRKSIDEHRRLTIEQKGRDTDAITSTKASRGTRNLPSKAGANS